MTDLSPEARAIIESARAAEHPTPADKHRIQAAIVVGISQVAPPAAAATVATTFVVKVVIGLLVATGISAGVAFVAGAFDGPGNSAPAHPRIAATAEPSAEPPAPAPEPVVRELVPEPETESAQPKAEPTPAEPPPRAKPRRKRPAQPAQASSIADELPLLQQATTALDSGDPAAALRHAKAHKHQFPHGQLTQEREALRIRALCQLEGTDRQAKHKAGTSFLKRWPRSPHAARVRADCGLP